MREIFVSELTKEVLGPRKGLRESSADSPLNEYISGVLAPLGSAPLRRNMESDSEIPFGDSQTHEDDTDDVGVSTPPMLSPALDPKGRPPSMGIAFVLDISSGDASIDVCLTWARYFGSLAPDGSKKTIWTRDPRFFTTTLNADKNQTLLIDSKGAKAASRESAEISLHIIVKKIRTTNYVTIYFVNRVKFSPDQPGDKPGVEYHIFQPQIRICHGPKNKLAVIEKPLNRDEEKELAFLYRKRSLMARGYLVSAMWRDIDPERKQIGVPESREPPFYWIDGELLLESERQKFSPPDVRTEFVPSYSIPTPSFQWDQHFGPSPELASSFYAECWEPGKLQAALEPLAAGYERWITSLVEEKSLRNDDSSADDGRIGKRLLDECQIVLSRIRKGIALLLSDENARLCFCLANKAIDLQSQWSRGEGLQWRPFQLAFILLTLESIANRKSSERDICDLLWVATGGGKTEAYLALAIFVMAYRRRRCAMAGDQADKTGAGVAVLTRYTLRLLTIQQFRRTLTAVTAAEYLRVYRTENAINSEKSKSGQSKGGMAGLAKVGWRPLGFAGTEDFLWGSAPFGIGLWVGQGVTPNRLKDSRGTNVIYGGLSILQGREGEGEPAQVLKCPACSALLAVPELGIKPDTYSIHFVFEALEAKNDVLTQSVKKLVAEYDGDISVSEEPELTVHTTSGYYTISVKVRSRKKLTAKAVDGLWKSLQQSIASSIGANPIRLCPVRASRPGYFLRKYEGMKAPKDYDFEIFCPNPACPLHSDWTGGSPAGLVHGEEPAPVTDQFPDGNGFIMVQEAFRKNGISTLSDRIPIPALTVDDQIYHRLPSMVVATVDKFARPAFEPRASSLFGNVEYYHCIWGYYRQDQHASDSDVGGHPGPAGTQSSRNYVRLRHHPDPPELILQDELHLIEGPLGSQVGFYENAVDFLCREHDGMPIKYIASTATVRRAQEQVQSVFARSLQRFPPYSLTSDDRFFVRDYEDHQLNDSEPGRLYVGVCAPGRGPLTPLRNICARLLEAADENRDNPSIDPYWTLTLYFNAIRELAGARALYRQDIPQRLDYISRLAGRSQRSIPDDRCVELSSRTDSTNLPAILDLLGSEHPDAQDALFTTSMFGTGVDIPRIGLMVVNGQPKTTSSYIQSTGRVGRRKGALVVTFLRSSRPRDLNHFEFFCGYHRQLHRFVEPITVYPFSPGVLERSGGPVAVFLLRNMSRATSSWHRNESPGVMAASRTGNPEVENILRAIRERAGTQPGSKADSADDVATFFASKLDAWHIAARQNGQNLRYVEYVFRPPPRYPVVLGNPEHRYSQLDVVFKNAPQSLRDIEETAGFEA